MGLERDARPFRMSSSAGGEGTKLRMLYFLFYGSAAAWFPFFNVYLQQIGLSGLQIGALSGIRPAITVVSQPPWGVVADLWGRRQTLLLTTLSAGLLLLGFMVSQKFWFLLLWTILHACLFTPVGPLIDSVALDYLDRTHNAASYGSLRLWGGIGWAATALVAGSAIAGRDMRLIFLFGTLFMILAWLATVRTPAEKGVVRPIGSSWRDFSPLLRNRRLLIFLALVMVLQVGTSASFAFFPIYLNEIGASRGLIGLAFGIQGVSELPLWLIAGAIIRRVGLTRTLVVTFLVFSARAFLYSIITQPALALAVQLGHGSIAVFLAASVEYVNRLVPGQWRATGQSLLWAAHMGVGAIIGNTFAGFLYDRVGVQTMYRLTGIIILAVAFTTIVALREDQARPSH